MKKKKSKQCYRKCVGCGNCVNMEISVSKCEFCGCKKWIDCVD